ncbi:MAG: tetratricopeptide repeat protein [Nitrospinaceae bacterium]|nr:tetratricopeptide repeat protein [Nitrospinaceae bacterium]MBT6396218.1 tetratricopeptide repeat protein [Nitrospinaceae bacterium]MBT7856257.1 tetratricopeptide repeat protein [Nitrospinaceae bacterium]
MKLRCKYFVICLLWLLLAAPFLEPAANAQGRDKPDDILLFGLKAYQDGFYDPAADSLARYLRFKPDGPKAANVRYYLAEALRLSERYKDARLAHIDFLARHPGDSRADKIRFHLAELYEKAGKLANAAEEYSKVSKGPFRAESAYREALLRLKEKSWDKATAALGEFIELAPRDPRVKSAVYERARSLDRLSRLDEAVKAYINSLNRFPKYKNAPAIRRRLGLIQFKLGKYEDAVSTLNNASRRSRKEAANPDVRLTIAASLYGQKKYKAAARAYEKALSLKVTAEQRRIGERGAAESWWSAKNYERAASVYRRLIKEKWGGAGALGRFVESVNRSGACGEKNREALHFASGVLRRGGKLSPVERLVYANCLEAAGMIETALTQFEEVAKSSGKLSRGAVAGLRVASILEEMGRPTEAAVRYQKLLARIDDFDKNSNVALRSDLYQGALRGADIFFRQGNCPSALKLIKAVPRKLVPDKGRGEVASLQAECAFLAKRYEEAELYFGKVLVLGRRPDLAARARVRLAAISEARGNKAESLQRLKEAIPILPEEIQREARLNVGRLLREMGEIDESRKTLIVIARDKKADATMRKKIWLLLARDAARAGAWNEADKALGNWMALSPSEPGEGLALWSTALFQTGECPRAIQVARRALDLATDQGSRISLLRTIASCLLKEEAYVEAVKSLEKIRELIPQDAEVAYQLAAVLERGGNLEKAAEAYESFLADFPSHEHAPGAALRLGFLMEGENNRKAALLAYRIALGSPQPSISEPARFQLALDAERRGALDEALASYEKLASQDLSQSKWRRTAAWRAAGLYERRGGWRVALKIYSRISKLSTSVAGGGVAREARQAAARVQKLEAYLASVSRREEKLKKRVPLFR